MNLLIGFLYGLVAQVMTFLQLQGSIKYGWYEKYPIIIILASIPSGWLFLKSVQHFVMAFDGEIWPSRLLGYGIGVIIFTLMSWQLFGEQLSTKTLVCLGLSVLIILIFKEYGWIHDNRFNSYTISSGLAGITIKIDKK